MRFGGFDYQIKHFFVVFETAFVASVVYVVVSTIFAAHGVYEYGGAVLRKEVMVAVGSIWTTLYLSKIIVCAIYLCDCFEEW